MSRQNPFGMHRQAVWLERSADSMLPDWIRLSLLAFARHRANGHANFGSGEIGQLLAHTASNGERQPLSKSAVSNAIKRAKDKGWIDRESCARCLVVPPHAVSGGLGSVYEKCRLHAKPTPAPTGRLGRR
jgi:hypothetical protein